MLKLGKYRHYKGKEYEAVGIAKHSETLEELVVYRALYGDGQIWVRPLKMFLEKVEFNGKKIPRFQYINKGNEKKECIFCEEIKKIKQGEDPYFVTELETGYVVMSWYQYFEGYTIFVFKNHITEFYLVESGLKNKFLCEMSLVAEAVYRAFKPKKLNYAMLGNGDPHMHWHLIPRYGTDPKPENTVWAIPDEIWRSDKQKPTEEKLNSLKEKLRKEIQILLASDKYKECHDK